MPLLPPSAIGEIYSSDALWSTLEELTDIRNRMAGQDGERQGADLIEKRMAAFGFQNVNQTTFEIPGWWRGSSSLTIDSRDSYDAAHEVIALPGTPAGEVEGQLVDLGGGTESAFSNADLDGQIVLVSSSTPDGTRSRHRMEKYADACDAGAAGFVFANHIEGCLPPTGEVGYHQRPSPIPAVGISRELGVRLSRACRGVHDATIAEPPKGGIGPEVRLTVECQNDTATSQNVEGSIGPKTDTELLVTAHVDAHDIAPGANDNGSGVAIALEVGRVLSSIEELLDRRVRIVIFGAEEIGLYGAYDFAEDINIDSLRGVVNVDVAGRSQDIHLDYNMADGLAEHFESAVSAFDASFQSDETVSPHGDQWAFVERGVPGVMVSSVPEDYSGRGWSHTHADTIDKLDPRDLKRIALQVTEAVLRIANSQDEFSYLTQGDISEVLSEGYEHELRAGDRWHFEDA